VARLRTARDDRRRYTAATRTGKERVAMAQGLYLGRQLDPPSGVLGGALELRPSDLLTHGLIVGMTGSGKTGLAIALIEEVLRQGVPVLAIDPKGDLGNLLLMFEDLSPASFRPWIDEAAARREGKSPDAAAEETAAAWRKGLGEWDLGPSIIAGIKKSVEMTIYTPGSSSGVALNVLQSLEAPSAKFENAEEDLRDEIAGIVSGLLGLLGIAADPLQSPELILLSTLIEKAWRDGKGLSLESLVTSVADPPFDKLGVLPLESVFPQKKRQGLMMALNNLLASPTFGSWRKGEPLDIGRLLFTSDGRPRLSIVTLAHLSDEERMFVTALLLDKVKTWMRQQGGTSELRALVYMDEVYGYFPPHPANPPSKRPLMTLLKQARAQGVGVVLATQNPVDLDYKGLANMGSWLVGKLQTDQDRERLRDGLLGVGADAKEIDQLLAATRKRVFLLHDVHRPGPCLLHSRWTLSYLRGPLTLEEISRLMETRRGPAQAGSDVAPGTAARSAAGTPAPAALETGPPVLPAPLRHNYLARWNGEIGHPHLLVKFAVRYKGAGETVAARAYPIEGTSPAEVLEQEPIEVDEANVSGDAPARLRYSDLQSFVASAGAKGLEKALKERLPDKLAATVFVDPVTDEVSQPGETVEQFAARISASGAEAKRRTAEEKLARKRRELEVKRQELSGRKQEKWVAIGSALLKNIGLLAGRKRSVSGVSSVLSKNRMEDTAEARVAALEAEVDELEKALATLTAVDPARLQRQELLPQRGAVKILRFDMLWVY
jgi:hypothetical protein